MDAGEFTLGSFLNPGRNVVPVVIATMSDGLRVLDAESLAEHNFIEWKNLLRCDVRLTGVIATVGLAWYDGLAKIEDRLASGKLLGGEEISGGYFFVLNPSIRSERTPLPANTLVLQHIGNALETFGVPSSAHEVPKLI